MSVRRAVAVVLLAGAALAAGGDHGAVAAQADGARAAVVVDLGGGQIRTACVTFSGDSISGLDLLRAAQMDPLVRSYSGEGGAVCKLCGKGCSAGSDCLTCQAPDYWQYWRAEGGDEPYEYSNAGAGTAMVTDGDLEGWRWGSDRTPPPYRTVESICEAGPVYRATSSGGAPATTTTTRGAPPSTTTTTPATAPADPPSPATTAAVPGLTRANAPSTTVAVPTSLVETSTSTAPSTTTTWRPAGERATAAERDVPDEPSSRWPGVVALAAFLGALGAWSVRLRRRRGNMR